MNPEQWEEWKQVLVHSFPCFMLSWSRDSIFKTQCLCPFEMQQMNTTVTPYFFPGIKRMWSMPGKTIFGYTHWMNQEHGVSSGEGSTFPLATSRSWFSFESAEVPSPHSTLKSPELQAWVAVNCNCEASKNQGWLLMQISGPPWTLKHTNKQTKTI